MSSPDQYTLDANVFIQSKRRFYAFDVCPGYWSALVWHQGWGNVGSIDKVREELERGADDLWQWVETQMPQSCFASTDQVDVITAFGQMVTWTQAEPQFLPQAKAEFASGVDAWLLAYAKAKGTVLVTLEELDPHIRRKVPIPNVCEAFGIRYVTTFQMLRELQTRFSWQAPR